MWRRIFWVSMSISVTGDGMALLARCYRDGVTLAKLWVKINYLSRENLYLIRREATSSIVSFPGLAYNPLVTSPITISRLASPLPDTGIPGDNDILATLPWPTQTKSVPGAACWPRRETRGSLVPVASAKAPTLERSYITSGNDFRMRHAW